MTKPDILDVEYFDSKKPERNFRHVHTREPAPVRKPEPVQTNQVYLYAGFVVLLLLILISMGVFINGKQSTRNSNADQPYQQAFTKSQSGRLRQASGGQRTESDGRNGAQPNDRHRSFDRGDRRGGQPDSLVIILQLKDGQISQKPSPNMGGENCDN